MPRSHWYPVCSVVLLLALSQISAAQTTMGTITGLVTDRSQAVIPGAGVVAKNMATGAEARTVTSSSGNYVIPNLSVGSYEVTASASGFKSWRRSNIALSSADNIRVDVTLEIGQVTENVQVTAQTPALKTESSDVSTTMERELVENVPLPIAGIGGGMRNAFSIMMMLPQVKSGNGESAWDDFQVGGGQQHDWNVSVDGLSVEMGWRNHVGYMNRLTPPVDSVQEFRIDTATFKAEDSRASGGKISVTTKSGTNNLHGEVFDYYQSQRFNANSWLNNKLGRPKPIFHRNDFGANLGGPVYLPKLYNGRNKTWFFFSFEGYRFPNTAGVSQLTIPSKKMRTGDFSEWKDSSGVMIPIYDPATTRSDGQGGFIRDPFPGNIIPPERLSPLAKAIAQYFPDPNAPGLRLNYNTVGTGPNKRIENAYLLKLDHSFGTKNRLAVTWSRNGEHFNNAYDTDPLNPLNWGNSLPYPLAGRQYSNGDQYYGNVFRINDTHVISATIVNTLTVGAHRLTHPEHDVTVDKNWGDKLGGAVKNNPYYNASFPPVRFETDNYYGWDSSKLWDEYHTVFGLDENVAWVKGSHSFKFGYSYQFMMLNTNNRNNAAGNFAFNRLETAAPADSSGKSGNAFASFMLGALHSGGFTVPSTGMLRFPYHAVFAQDDWKMTPRLTMNIGLRYEVNIGAFEKHDRMSYFDPSLPNPAADGYPGALRFLGFGPGREGRRNLWNNAAGWGPRIGLAYQVTPKTVVRAGFGIFYASEKAPGLTPSNVGFTSSPSWGSADSGITPAFYWDQGFPAWKAPPFINPGFNAGFGVSWWPAAEIAMLPSTNSWNVAVSRAMGGNFVLDLTYTGSKGTHLASDRVNYMQIPPQYAKLGSLLNKPIDDPAVVALGFTPPFPSFKQLLGSRATLGQSLRMWPQYTGVGTGGMNNHSGNSTYNALIVKVTKRYSGGLSMVADYTWSKLLTDADSSEPWIAGVVGSGVGAGAAQNHWNRRAEKSYGVLDLPHMVKVTAAYDLPFGPKRRFASSGVLGQVIGHWNVAAFIYGQSGYPLGVVDSGFSNFLSAGTPRPNVTSSNWRAPIVGDKFDPANGPYLSRSAFERRTNPTVDPFGNAPRLNGATRSPGRVRENISIARSFPIRERAQLDFRWEIYDLFNLKTWNNPASADLSNPLFGMVTNASGNRTMQFGLKLVF
ncbi:MAG TPA: carboxypeptidase regulatory-like domain-containing protein [Candidatus Dormibacteraeota bacterium]|nr:carboxypeptidase regulatory-like domain-containing protein [Candidatus Dormibacteraeota bacterium]